MTIWDGIKLPEGTIIGVEGSTITINRNEVFEFKLEILPEWIKENTEE